MTETQLNTLIFFRTKYIPQEVLNKIRDKSVTHNILYYVWILLHFDSLVCVPVGITSSAVGKKQTCTMTAGMKKYRSTIKKKMKLDTVMLLGKTKINTIKSFNQLYNSHAFY